MRNFIKTVFNAFVGVVNSKSLWEIGPAYRSLHGKKRQMVELYKVTNYDITPDLKLKKRNGTTKLLSGVFTDLWTDGTGIYCVKDGDLVLLASDLSTTTTLKTSVSSPVCYTKAGLDVVWTDGTYIEYVSGGGSHSFPESADASKTAIPAGRLVEWFFGRLLVASGRNLYQTDPLVRRTAAIDFTTGNHRQLASNITLIKTVDDGFWVSDETALYFGKGNNINEAALVIGLAYPAMFNAAVKIDGSLFPEPLLGTCYAVATQKGIIVLGNSGVYTNLTEKDYNMLSGESASILFKQTATLNQVIVSIKE